MVAEGIRGDMENVKKTSKNGIGKGTPGPGRPKGKPNKATAELKDMIAGALNDVGGQKYLAAQALDNPAAFMTLIGKTLPKDVNATHDGGISVTVYTGVKRAGD